MITMTRPLRILYPDAFSHVAARGNERKAVFPDERDRERYLAVIHVYCLRLAIMMDQDRKLRRLVNRIKKNLICQKCRPDPRQKETAFASEAIRFPQERTIKTLVADLGPKRYVLYSYPVKNLPASLSSLK